MNSNNILAAQGATKFLTHNLNNENSFYLQILLFANNVSFVLTRNVNK